MAKLKHILAKPAKYIMQKHNKHDIVMDYILRFVCNIFKAGAVVTK